MSLYGENGYNRGGCFSDDKSHQRGVVEIYHISAAGYQPPAFARIQFCKSIFFEILHAVSLVYRVDDVDASYAYQLFNKLTQGRDGCFTNAVKIAVDTGMYSGQRNRQ